MIMMAEGVGTNATQIKNVIAADKVGAARTTFNVPRPAARSYETYPCEQPSRWACCPCLMTSRSCASGDTPAGSDVRKKLSECLI
jgi:hypothetical protein